MFKTLFVIPIYILVFSIVPVVAGVESQNDTAYQECFKISKTNSIVGKFGSRSIGGSTGTYVSLIILSLQDINLEGKKLPKDQISIYEVCKKAYKQNNNAKHDFILTLNKIIKQENEQGKLIVFTTLQELLQYQK